MKPNTILFALLSLVITLSACGAGGSDNNPPPASTGKWTWVSGSNLAEQAGAYGTRRTADPANVPGARDAAVSWIDSSGKLWLFGGQGYDSAGSRGYLNDLWEYDPATHEWTWISGYNISNWWGSYGTKGTGDPENGPGGREFAVSWIDSQDKLWLFGGYGYDSAGGCGYLNDLWKFDPATYEWTWVSGGNTISQAGIYGTRGIADPANVPGARLGAVSWIDSSGKLWLFGGGSEQGWVNDLWKYDPTTLEWTWTSGSNTFSPDGHLGISGTKGIADPANVPGTRVWEVSWIDSQDRLWLFGGSGRDAVNGNGNLNCLWNYDPAISEWTWVSGSNAMEQEGSYGTLGITASTNVPGARCGAVSWIDSSGNFWLFGGVDSPGSFNDLWKYDPTTNEWTWESGSKTIWQPGTYGTKGIAAMSNMPGGRMLSVSWIDPQDRLWLFGGSGQDAANGTGRLNDLWQYKR